MVEPKSILLAFPANGEQAYEMATGTPYLVECPVCGKDYVSPGDAIRLDGEDDYKAWYGRGDCVKLAFSCEQGHGFVLCFGIHKGQTVVFWENGD